MDVLLVDGYNIIGAWPDLQALRNTDFSAARDKLISRMAEYKAFTGTRVIIVFDAHFVPGAETKTSESRVEVIYTREKETADERIERLVSVLKNVRTQIYVATSDYTEQWTVFSQGALRKSARELYIEMQNIDRQIASKVQDQQQQTRRSTITFSDEVTKLFEKWRRGQ
ncbi:putative RNA-binding protein with PIN domain [Pullulanibacillus pueri]|uniref:NYN domain-containing protein n=1 Tax=Pullulanibacillus pueri TaxID=1437324 RepID=A0A8J2ZXW5_9BACL|nr:NYN domain-containing protein [Pullulanibacillus pueri]MBM7683155.1 putative RNA-binding protein with PIN domain [Pullulanibacillus pueri]GGH85445.1 hypothetical protein GCM10007096_30860 [Pullulanibacillus pueri]